MIKRRKFQLVIRNRVTGNIIHELVYLEMNSFNYIPCLHCTLSLVCTLSIPVKGKAKNLMYDRPDFHEGNHRYIHKFSLRKRNKIE